MALRWALCKQTAQMLQLSSVAVQAPAPASLTHRCSRRSACSVKVASRRTGRAERRNSGAAAATRRCVRAQAAAAAAAAGPEVGELKMALLDSFWGTDRGLAASSDSRAEINELITQLEARNPTPAPNDARALLSGTWRLAYTSNSELIALLALDRLPLVTVGEITQAIDPLGQTVENRVELAAPLSKTSLSATASFEVRSPKLLQVVFEEGRVATPTLLADLDLPASIDVLGQTVDLKPLQAVLQPVEAPLKSALGALGGLLSSMPDLRLPIQSVSASSWLLNTYLDDTLRISRGDGSSVFVLVKDPAEAGAEGGYGYVSTMQPTDWERIEEQDPVQGNAEVVTEVVAAAAGEVAVVAVVEVEEAGASDRLGGSNSNGNGSAGGGL